MILTKDFHNDVIKSEYFRGRLRVFAIDEIHHIRFVVKCDAGSR